MKVIPPATLSLILLLAGFLSPAIGQTKISEGPSARPETDKSLERQLDWMKDFSQSQKEMYQSHLATVTLFIGLAVVFLTIAGIALTVWELRSNHKSRLREDRLNDMQQVWREQQNQREQTLLDDLRNLRRDQNARDQELHTERLNLSREQSRVDQELRDRSHNHDAKNQSYIDQVIKYTENSGSLIVQMKTMLEIYQQSQKIVTDALEAVKQDNIRKEHEATMANDIAGAFLKKFSISDDGFAIALREKTSEMNFHRVRASDDKLQPQVSLVEGMFEWQISRNIVLAERIWTDKVLNHKQIQTEPRIKARTEYCLGLALTQDGRYSVALTYLRKAADAFPQIHTYQMAILQARIYYHRAGNKLNANDLSAVERELQTLWGILLKEGDNIELGSMKPEYFRGWLGYTYAAFLTHELGNPEALERAGRILDELVQQPQNRSAELDGIRCAIAVKQKNLTIAAIDEFMGQCEVDLLAVADTEDRIEEFSHNMRKARLLGRRAALHRAAKQMEEAAVDEQQLSRLLILLQGKLMRMQRSTPEASIYSPFTRIHESLKTIETQLDTQFKRESFDRDFDMDIDRH